RWNVLACRKLMPAANQEAVDQRAIKAAEVADEDALGSDAQYAMLAADPIAVGLNVALRPPAKNVLAGREEETLALGASVNDEQLDVHCTPAPLWAVTPATAQPRAVKSIYQLCIAFSAFATRCNYFSAETFRTHRFALRIVE